VWNILAVIDPRQPMQENLDHDPQIRVVLG